MFSGANPQGDGQDVISSMGAAMKKMINARIDEPLPLLPKLHKNHHLIGNLPRIAYM